ncbi:hypothetical protein PF002_g26371 [Phytophthora fragariae]|uniref:Uncharacterized protein n=1 Tax=Phytophthora fragariae TaxID=53985 RepID=A0A6A3WLG2_9STRA|nr:hypothetical protein PF002_g26371 [Phytophthora fragariae]
MTLIDQVVALFTNLELLTDAEVVPVAPGGAAHGLDGGASHGLLGGAVYWLLLEPPTDLVVGRPTDMMVEGPTDVVAELPTDSLVERSTDLLLELGGASADGPDGEEVDRRDVRFVGADGYLHHDAP